MINKALPKLSPLQVKQLDYLMKEYPMLDLMSIESVLRISPAQQEKIVEALKDGSLEHEKPEDVGQYIIQSVEVE